MLFKNIILFFIGLLMLLLIYQIDNIIYLIYIFFIYTFLVSYSYSKISNLLDPRVLLIIFFTLYSTYFPLLSYFVGYDELSYNNYVLILSIRYQFLALFVLVTVLNIVIKNNIKNKKSLFFLRLNNNVKHFSEDIIFFISSVIVLLVILFIIKSGVSSKRELVDNVGILDEIGLFAVLLLTASGTKKIVKLEKNFIYDFKMYIFLFITFLYMITTGERDAFFRVGFIILLVLSDRKNNTNFLYVLLIIFAITIIIPLSQALKAILLSNNDISLARSGLNLILYSEFMSASRNLYSLLIYGVKHSIEFYFNDIIRAFVPSIISSSLDLQSATSWYEHIYRVNNGFSGRAGWGFGLVAEGYLIGSIYGIILVMSTYAITIGVIYNNRYKSIYWYVFYLITFVTSIYVIRADLANLFSQVFKIGGLSVLILFLLHKFLQKR